MTFSQLVKEELLVQDIDPKTAKVELIAAFKAIGVLIFDSTNIMIELKTSQIKLTKRLLEILHHEYPRTQVQTLVSEIRSFNGKQKQYVLRISTDVRHILYDLKFIEDENQSFIIGLPDITDNLIDEDSRQVYVRTFFCCLGSVNDPKNAQQYHLEITNSNKEYLQGICNILSKYNINMKITKRRSSYAAYLNKSEEIADFLKFARSFDMLFEYEDLRMERDIKAMINRLDNAEMANEMKRLVTSNAHLKAIEDLKEHNAYNGLKDKTKKVCELRIANPEESLQELADLSNGEFSKSTIKYHLAKVVELAEIYKDSNE